MCASKPGDAECAAGVSFECAPAILQSPPYHSRRRGCSHARLRPRTTNIAGPNLPARDPGRAAVRASAQVCSSVQPCARLPRRPRTGMLGAPSWPRRTGRGKAHETRHTSRPPGASARQGATTTAVNQQAPRRAVVPAHLLASSRAGIRRWSARPPAPPPGPYVSAHAPT
jgi:hypothetical protein